MFGAQLLMLLAAAQPAGEDARLIPAFFTGERLYEICAGPEEAQCWMYVAGVLDGVFEAETGAERTICATQISNRDAAKLVMDYLRENKDMRPKAAAVAVQNAVKSKLACPADTRA
jgi:hypothetical protein